MIHVIVAAGLASLISASISGVFNGDEGYKRGRAQGFNEAVAVFKNGIAGVTYPVGPKVIHCDFTQPGKPRCDSETIEIEKGMCLGNFSGTLSDNGDGTFDLLRVKPKQ